jgi:hypothetical protein
MVLQERRVQREHKAHKAKMVRLDKEEPRVKLVIQENKVPLA